MGPAKTLSSLALSGIAAGVLLGLVPWEVLLQNPTGRLLSAAVVTLAFTAAARLLRGVSASGAMAGAVIAFVLYSAAGPRGFLCLLAVFVLTFVATRIGRTRKREMGVAEPLAGRNAQQVLANLWVAAAGFGLGANSGRAIFFVAGLAALAEAAADTVSSEVGQALSANAYMVGTFRRVPAGTDGGWSVPGTLAAGAASMALGGLSHWLLLTTRGSAVFIAVAGFAGMVVDSILGATLQRWGILGNEGVNFVGTASAAAVAAGLLAL